MTFDPIKDGTLRAASQKLEVCRFDYDAHLYKIWKKSVKKCGLQSAHISTKYDLWPNKRRNTGGSITKNNRRVDFTMIHLHTNMKEIRQEMQLLERTQECEPKYDLWPYTRRNTGGSITKNYRCVDLTMMHICTKFERNPSRNVACRAHTRFPPTYDLWPYKRWNTGGSITNNNKRVDFTKIHLHTKFERNLSRNAAVKSAHKNVNQNMTFDPIKDGTLGATPPKTIGL